MIKLPKYPLYYNQEFNGLQLLYEVTPTTVLLSNCVFCIDYLISKLYKRAYFVKKSYLRQLTRLNKSNLDKYPFLIRTSLHSHDHETYMILGTATGYRFIISDHIISSIPNDLYIN